MITVPFVMPIFAADLAGDISKVLLAAAPLLGAVAAVIAAINVYVGRVTERRRNQPIVIAHEDQARQFNQGVGAWLVRAHLTNDGIAPAFNVRFGVDYGGVRFPYRMADNDPEEGNYQRVLTPGARLPKLEPESLPIVIASTDIWAAGATTQLNESPTYWCRFENAFGETWETTNPADRSSRLQIRKRKKVREIEAAEQAERKRVRGTGGAALREAFDKLPGRNGA